MLDERQDIHHPRLLARKDQLRDERLSLVRILEVQPLAIAEPIARPDADEGPLPVLAVGCVVRIDGQPVDGDADPRWRPAELRIRASRRCVVSPAATWRSTLIA